MGLTIHYSIEADPHCTRREIRQKLADVRRFALTLPIASVSEVAEFRRKDCDWQQQAGETPDETDARDPFRWLKIQASRDVASPWRPGCSCGQAPTHMLCLSVWPAEGCEQMNIGWCSYPRFVWKPEADISKRCVGWGQVLGSPSSHRESAKILRAFLKKYRLVKMPDKQVEHRRWSQCQRETVFCLDEASVTVWASYLSHRRGYGPGRIELLLLAGLAGVIKDAVEVSGADVESSILGRPDFERIETQAVRIESIAGHLAKLREQLLPSPEASPCR